MPQSLYDSKQQQKKEGREKKEKEKGKGGKSIRVSSQDSERRRVPKTASVPPARAEVSVGRASETPLKASSFLLGDELFASLARVTPDFGRIGKGRRGSEVCACVLVCLCACVYV